MKLTLMVGVLTGHCPLGRHLHTMGITVSTKETDKITVFWKAFH